MTRAAKIRLLTAVYNEINSYALFGDQPPADLLELLAWLEQLDTHD